MRAAKVHSVLMVNGESRDVLAPVSTTLLDALRDSLSLTGGVETLEVAYGGGGED